MEWRMQMLRILCKQNIGWFYPKSMDETIKRLTILCILSNEYCIWTKENARRRNKRNCLKEAAAVWWVLRKLISFEFSHSTRSLGKVVLLPNSHELWAVSYHCFFSSLIDTNTLTVEQIIFPHEHTHNSVVQHLTRFFHNLPEYFIRSQIILTRHLAL